MLSEIWLFPHKYSAALHWLQGDHMTLMIMDIFKGQDNDAIADLCTDNNWAIVIVPHKLTSKFQPMDIMTMNLLNVWLKKIKQMFCRASYKPARQREKPSRCLRTTQAIINEVTARQSGMRRCSRIWKPRKTWLLIVSSKVVLPKL